ncbi:hypothetical protein AAA214_04740 [Parabacteroides goldsteinii]
MERILADLLANLVKFALPSAGPYEREAARQSTDWSLNGRDGW